jgi:peptidoglycan/LPS O-acetylase OafA/YrhL
MVFLFHFQTYVKGKGLFGAGNKIWGYVQEWIQRGAFGVPLFFVMSGYLFAATMAARPLDSSQRVPFFYRARLRRLYPAYAVNICILWVCGIGRGTGFAEWFQELLVSLVGSSYWILGRPSQINGVAWSLEVELQFYLFAPWLALALSKLGAPARIWVLAGCTALAVWLREGMGCSDKTCLGNLHFFLGGWLLFLGNAGRSPDAKMMWDALALLLLAGMRWIPRDAPGTQILLLGWSIGLVSAGLKGRLWRRVLSAPGLLVIGAMSYTIYLYHYPVLSFLGRGMAPALNRVPDLLAMAVFGGTALLFTGACCAVFFSVFEKPFMGRPRSKRRPHTVHG